MKKPFSILAIAILLSAQFVVPVSRTYADDAPAPAPVDAAPAADSNPAPAPVPDPVPVPNPSPAPSPTPVTDTPPGPPAGGGPLDASSNEPAVAESSPSDSTVVAEAAVSATSTPPLSEPIATTTPSELDQNASVSNTATTTSTVVSDASTGGNSATSTDNTGITAIQTGDAIATADVVNVVNVNLFNSDALVAFLDNLSAGDTTINLDSSAFDHDGSIGCSGCATQISATDTASISNTAVARASTGDNSVSGGDAAISTGNAYAAANVATLANVTLVDSHYVMLVLNNFGSWAGNLVLPGVSFWDSFLNPSVPTGNAGVSSGSTDVSVTNAADVTTNASTSAQTGNNVASSTDGASAIQTGSAMSTTNTVNDVNRTHVGGATVDIIFHIFGNWSGHALNLPPGFTAIQTPDGLEIVASNAGSSAVNQGALALSAANNAFVQNNLSASASTGGNSASGTNAGISTGNAYAAANSITAANVTSISHNWLAAIVNIFGDWDGDVTFGAPDLWVGIRADMPDGAVGPGNHIVYHYTVKNMGDAAAHHAHLSRTIGSDVINTDQEGSWDLGALAPGDTREISETVTVDQSVGFKGQQSVSNTVQVSEDETDAHTNNNTDVISLVVGFPTYVGGGSGTPGPLPHFVITKTSNATTTLAASSTVDYVIHLLNDGGQANHAIVTDQITDQNGAVIHAENWDLGIVKAHEDITLAYTAFFSASSTPGVYRNSAQVTSVDNQFDSSAVASTSITIAGSAASVLPSFTLGTVSSGSGSLSTFGSLSKYMTNATSTVRRPIFIGFVDKNLPLPPDAGGPVKVEDGHSLIASVGNLAMTPYAWSLYLLVLAAGGWYLVHKRKEFGWGMAQDRGTKVS